MSSSRISLGLLASLLFVPRLTAPVQGEWVTHGPAGNFRSLAVAPSDPNTVYAGEGGVYVSTDGGRSWASVSNGIPASTVVEAVAVDPTNPDIVYAATEIGVYKSTNGGATWIEMNVGLLHTVMFSIAIDPTDPQTIYAGSGRGLPGEILFKSTDGAATWVDVTGDIKNTQILALAVDPVDPQVIYVGGGTLYKSTNGGSSWGASESGIPKDEATTALAIDPQHPSLVYAGMGSPAPGPDVYISSDAGATWVPATGGPVSKNVDDLALDPAHPSTIYAGGAGGVYKTTDGGTIWTQLSDGLPSIVEALEIDPLHPATLYASEGTHQIGESVGIYKTSDAGQTWRRLTFGLSGLTIVVVAVDPSEPDTILAAPSAPRLIKSTDGGHRWSDLGRGVSQIFTDLVIDPSDTRVLYGSTFGFPATVMKSTNAGKSWTDSGQGLVDAVPYDLDIDPFDSAHLVLASVGVWVSTDGAASWQPTGLELQGFDFTIAVTFDPTDPQTIYAGTFGDLSSGGVYKTTDGGDTWRAILHLRGLSQRVLDIEVDPTDPKIVYVGAGNSISGRVLKSTDGGQTWLGVGTHAITASVADLAIDPTNSSIIYAGTSQGVYVSSDAGGEWSELNQGLICNRVNSLTIDRTGSRLYAGACGVFRLDVG